MSEVGVLMGWKGVYPRLTLVQRVRGFFMEFVIPVPGRLLPRGITRTNSKL
jgi:hypothetical protein